MRILATYVRPDGTAVVLAWDNIGARGIYNPVDPDDVWDGPGCETLEDARRAVADLRILGAPHVRRTLELWAAD